MNLMKQRKGRRSLRALLLAAAVTAVACDDLTTAPTPPATTISLQFSSQLMAGGMVWRSFTVSSGGTVSVLFTSLLPESDAVVSLGLGTFDGGACAVTSTATAKSGSTDAVLTTTLTPGNYCVRISDPGVLTKTNDFSVTVSIPTGS